MRRGHANCLKCEEFEECEECEECEKEYKLVDTILFMSYKIVSRSGDYLCADVFVFFNNMPDDVVIYMLSFLDLPHKWRKNLNWTIHSPDLLKMARLNRRFYLLANSAVLWKFY